MQSASLIRSVLIVGGGTAGWMSAMLLNRVMRRIGGRVTVIEAPDIGTIGVGEATIPSLVGFIRQMGFDEAAFMRACSATYKLGIRFHDWVRPGHDYWHPFGPVGGAINGVDLYHFWLRRRHAGREAGAYTDYSLQALLGQAGKAPRPPGGATTISKLGSFAYHLDASQLATFLRIKATGEGVEHLYGTVQSVPLTPEGAIDRVVLPDGRALQADLYVDCSGFAGVLAEKALADPWIDWSDVLLCDRAVAMPVARDGAYPPYTASTALDAGWHWQIPLSSRTGMGYVYSSRHLDADAAERALVERAGFRRARTADPRHLAMRVGRRARFWNRNCVAIGLSGGFVEPLESTGIHLIQRGVELLVDFFPGPSFDPAPIAAYNGAMARAYAEVRDFILLHYLLNRRDEPFWRDARSVALTDALAERLALYDEIGVPPYEGPGVFGEPSYHAILAGGERLARRPQARADVTDDAEVERIFSEIKAQNQRLCDAMPSHRDFLSVLHGEAL